MHTICPSWSFSTRSCLVSQDFLYLPVEEHVAIYCEGGGYASCPQSINCQTTVPVSKQEFVERRRVKRTIVRMVTRIMEGVGIGQNKVVTGAAVTVDISIFGLCLEVCQALVEGSEVLFSVDSAVSTTPVHAAGTVQWCRVIDNSSLFHAGIELSDTTSFQQISRQIERLCR